MVSRYFPVDAESFVIPGNGTFAFLTIQIITLVLEYGCFAQYTKAMCKTSWDKKLALVILSQFHCYMLTKGRTAFADINSNIKYTSFHYAYQLTL